MSAQNFIPTRNLAKTPLLRNLYFFNSVIFFSWWIVLNPGFYSSDSIAVLERIANRSLSSEWTYLWDLSIYMFTFGGKFPHLATLVCGLILVLSFTFFCCSFFDKRTSRIVSIFMSNLPIVFGLGLTLWHDVMMTSGLLLFVSAVKKSQQTGTVRSSIYLVAFVLVNTRLNGFWTVLFSLGALLSFRRITLTTFAKLSMFLILVTAPFTYLNTIKSTNENAQVSGLTHWMKYDIACYLYTGDQSGIPIREKMLEYDLAPVRLTSSSACKWFMEPQALSNWGLVPAEKIFKIWIELFQQDTISVFEIHSNRAEYLVFNPSRIPERPPFLHTTIEYVNPWVQEWNPNVYQIARNYPRVWNFLGPLTAYAGLWWFLILTYSIRNRKYLPIIIVSSVLNVSIFVTAIIPDARYVAFTILTGMALSIAELCKFISKRTNRSNNE